MKVSVIISCFNGEAFIGDALRSVLSQTHTDLECIIVDDASTDGSKEVICAFVEEDRRVRPIFLERNVGLAAARNHALAAATGEWVTFLDADDLYEQDRLRRLVELAVITNGVMVVDNQSVRRYPNGRHLFTGFRFLRGTKPIEITQELFFREEAHSGARLRAGYMKPMIATSWLQNLGMRFDPKYRIGQDCFFFGELFAYRSRCFGTSYMGYIYRRRNESLSMNAPQSLRFRASILSDLLEKHRARLSKSSIASLKREKRELDRYAAMHDIRFASRDLDFRRAFSVVQAQPDFGFALVPVLRRRIASMFVR
jgi:glycosyltransferase involved in cell wall biosynthesis